MSTMLIPGLNQLAEPEIVRVEDFESLLADFKALTLAYVQSRDPQKAARLAESLNNESELLAMVMEVFTLRLQAHERKYSDRIKQMLAWWAEGSNLDARAADMGIARRVISPGDPRAFPPVPAEMEADDDLRLRYYLAPHAPAAGSRMHYLREALTLGDRAAVTVKVTDPGVVVATYTLQDGSLAAQVKDARPVRTAPGVVTVWILGRGGRGEPSEALLSAQRAHFAREDTRPETDTVEILPAEIVSYTIRATAYINPGPDAEITRQSARDSLAQYAAAEHRLKGYVDPDHIRHRLIAAGATRLAILEPLTAIACSDGQAPFCELIDVDIEVLEP